MTPGTYYARVYPQGSACNASNCYTLTVQLVTASRHNRTDVTRLSSNGIYIFPNPGGYNVSLAFNALTAGSSEIPVINLVGSVVLRINTRVTEGENIRKLDVSRLPNGVYLVQVKWGTGSQTVKFFINK